MSVFIVDDEPIIAATTAEILKLHGYSPVSFTVPRDALQAVKCACPRLLIADMPGISGVELAIQTKRLCADCGVILFTGQLVTPDLHNEISERGFLILHKPASPAELLLAVAAMMRP